ncbi:MAG: membrane protein insertion efficiency factor YidD [Dehalococcoidia bacterium]
MKAVLLLVVRGYRRLISPVLPPLCRYEPSCSRYMETAIEVHGPVKGAWLGLRRLARCTPWGGSGYDPVPGAEPPAEGV